MILGTDFEFFVFSRGMLIPARLLKKHFYVNKKRSFHDDGLAGELSISPGCAKTLVENTNVGLKLLKKCLLHYNNAKYSLVPYQRLYRTELDVNDKDLLLGCEPDFNAWSNKIQYPPEDYHSINFRTLGGHIHLGYTPKNRTKQFDTQLVKCLDLLVGTTSVILTIRNQEEEILRRTLYGRAGSFRIKRYGIEYRVLSSFIIRDRRIFEFILDLCKETYYLLDHDKLLSKIKDKNEIIEAINTCNYFKCKSILADINNIFFDNITKNSNFYELKNYIGRKDFLINTILMIKKIQANYGWKNNINYLDWIKNNYK